MKYELRTCPACQQKMSFRTSRCMSCGEPDPFGTLKRMRWLKNMGWSLFWLLASVGVFVVLKPYVLKFIDVIKGSM